MGAIRWPGSPVLPCHRNGTAHDHLPPPALSGKDVSMLFPDVLNCMQTNNLELKKLVYLCVRAIFQGVAERAAELRSISRPRVL